MNRVFTSALQGYVELGVAMRPAATQPPDPPNPFSGWVGKPDTKWLSGIKSGVYDLTGKAIGAIAIAAVLMVIAGGLMMIAAGRRSSRAEDGSKVILNVLKGAGVIFIGVPILVGVLGAVAVAFG